MQENATSFSAWQLSQRTRKNPAVVIEASPRSTLLLQLQKETDERVQTLGSRAANATKVIRYLYQRPLIDAEEVRRVTGISMPLSYKLIKDMERLDVLKEITDTRILSRA